MRSDPFWSPDGNEYEPEELADMGAAPKGVPGSGHGTGRPDDRGTVNFPASLLANYEAERMRAENARAEMEARNVLMLARLLFGRL